MKQTQRYLRSIACCLSLFAFVVLGWAGAPPIAVSPPIAFVIHDACVVPVRPLCEILGAEVRYERGTVTVTRDDRRFVCSENAPTAEVNGKTVALPWPVMRYIGTICVPLRPLMEAFGGTVMMEASKRTIVITAPQADSMRLAVVDGLKYFYGDDVASRDLYAISLDTQQRRQLTYTLANERLPTFSASGRWFVFPRENYLVLRGALASDERIVYVPPEFNIREIEYGVMCFSPDDTALYVSLRTWLEGATYESESSQPTLIRIALPDGAVTKLGRGTEPAISADGKWMAFVRDAQVQLLELSTGKTRPLGAGDHPQFSADGQWLYADSPDEHTVALWNTTHKRLVCPVADLAQGGGQFRALLDTPDTVEEMVSQDGKLIAFVDAHHRICCMNRDGSDRRVLAQNGSLPSLSPDGRNLAYSVGGRYHVVDVATGQRVLDLQYYLDFCFTPDSRSVIVPE